jgi:hypothetical protein
MNWVCGYNNTEGKVDWMCQDASYSNPYVNTCGYDVGGFINSATLAATS